MSDFTEVLGSEPETRLVFVRFTGGAAAVTKSTTIGLAATVTYISTGIVDITFGPAVTGFTFVDLIAHQFTATTQSAVKGFTAVAGVLTAATRVIRINITNASETLADLAAAQNLSLTFMFKATGAVS